MARFQALALFALLSAAANLAPAGGDKEKVFDDLKTSGMLTNDDPKDKKLGAASKVYLVKMTKGNVYTIDMRSKAFDAYLRLEDKDSRELAEDDDSGGNLDARIVFSCSTDGEYKVICTALGNGLGPYTLTVTHKLNTAKGTTAHQDLIGKPAPDFEGDFAVNGKVVRPSDLKGKVVLLEFSDLRLDSCIAANERLRDWHQRFEGAGLAIVCVTFYSCEIGNHIGFDKDSGKLLKVDAATKQSEQAAVKEFASHHKLPHLLMALPKEAASKAFADYAVNGLPQSVLIDRQGIVRVIWIGDEKNASILENEVKKLLAQK